MEIQVPDIGDFTNVPVIELLVKPGDAIKKDDPLVTLESEKATFEVPSPQSGVIASVSVKIGDKVSQGTPIVILDEAGHDDRKPSDTLDQSAQVMESPGAPAPAKTSGASSQSVELRVPDIGDFKDIPVIEVLVKAGDNIRKEDPLVTLESEKATFEVPASQGGVVGAVAINVGDKVSQGTVIATITTALAAEDDTALRQAQGDTGALRQAQGDTGALRQAQGDTGALRQAQGDTGALRQAQGDTGALQQAQGDTGALQQAQGDTGVHASPSIRRFARELGVDMRIVAGSGPSGRITREDVQRYVKNALQSATPSSSGAGLSSLGLAAWPKIDFAQYGPIESKPLSRIQKISGPNLHRNWVMIPHVTNNEDADVTDLEEFRKTLNAENAKLGVKVTMLAFLIKAVVASLQAFPNFNASLDGDNLVVKKYYNIGFAADTPNGLIVPVIKNADRKGVLEIARETADLSAKGRDGKLGPGDMSGGTFTISSLGGIGGTYFTPIINAPEVGILGVCRAAMRPVWNGAEFTPRLLLPLSLSYDHRVIDGATAARFNVHLAGLLADMRRTLL